MTVENRTLMATTTIDEVVFSLGLMGGRLRRSAHLRRFSGGVAQNVVVHFLRSSLIRLASCGKSLTV